MYAQKLTIRAARALQRINIENEILIVNQGLREFVSHFNKGVVALTKTDCTYNSRAIILNGLPFGLVNYTLDNMV